MPFLLSVSVHFARGDRVSTNYHQHKLALS
jgi:hypothetical protein